MSSVVVHERFAGPPNMGHGGYVAGLFVGVGNGAVQATLRRPIPIDSPLSFVDASDGEALELRSGDDLIAEARPARLELDVPAAPSVADARAAEAGSPSHFNDGLGVHPTCFGCGLRNEAGLQIAAGPTNDGSQVAAVWNPASEWRQADGTVAPGVVVAALDCAGAFAYMVDGIKAGLLGRLVFELYAPVAAGVDHVLTGWRIEIDGKKMYAGTAITSADGTVLAAAKATWFGWS